MEYNKKIIENINIVLKKNKMSQKDLSQKLALGTSAISTKFGRIKSGGTMTIESLVKIARALEVEPWELLK
ncbi:MAG: helix-turn-helix transcriptional regulator [Cetobacterium sp.]